MTTTKLLKFPDKKTQIPFDEAVLQILDNANQDALKSPVRNMVIISENEDGYNFCVLNEHAITSLLGCIDLVKTYMMMSVIGSGDFDPMDKEEE